MDPVREPRTAIDKLSSNKQWGSLELVDQFTMAQPTRMPSESWFKPVWNQNKNSGDIKPFWWWSRLCFDSCVVSNYKMIAWLVGNLDKSTAVLKREKKREGSWEVGKMNVIDWEEYVSWYVDNTIVVMITVIIAIMIRTGSFERLVIELQLSNDHEDEMLINKWNNKSGKRLEKN